MQIDRTLFWFKDRGEAIGNLDDKFFAYGTFLNRLLNEKYQGKKIKFINLFFYTKETYELYPVLKANSTHYHNGHMNFNGLIELVQFNKLNSKEQIEFLWNKAYLYLQECAKATKNNELMSAVVYAYQKGKEVNFDPDYRIVESTLTIYGKNIKAAVWVHFKEPAMISELTLEDNNGVFFEKELNRSKNGVEYFLDMYKGIEYQKENIVITGRKDAGIFPILIPINDVRIP